MIKKITGLKIQIILTVLSIILFLFKATAYYYTHSLAILSDALESIINIVTAAFGIYALHLASKPQDTEHPYGHGKVEFISAGIEGSFILISGCFIIYEAIKKFNTPLSIQNLNLGIILVIVSGGLNFLFGRIALQKATKTKSVTLYAAGKHLLTDTYSSIAVVVGLLLIIIFKTAWIDKIIAITLGIVILKHGYQIFRTSLAGIMDEADKSLIEQIIELINANRTENWIDIHNLRVIKYGSKLHLDCHLTVAWYISVNDAHKEIDKLTSLLYNHFGEDAIEFFVHTDGCVPMSCGICYKKDCRHRQSEFTNKVNWTFNNIVLDEKHQ